MIPPILRLTRPQLVLLASWLVVSAALAVVGVVTWSESHSVLAELFWGAAVVVAVAAVAVAIWYRSRPGSTRRW